MHTRDRAYRCQSRKCGSLSSRRVTQPSKSTVRKKTGRDDGVKSDGKARSSKNSPVRCSPDELAEHGSTLNLMSDTLMSVANKLEEVFNKPKEGKPVSRPTIKRVYVIKFDNKGSQAKEFVPKTRKRYFQAVRDHKRKMKSRSEASLVGNESGRTQRFDEDETLNITESFNEKDDDVTTSPTYQETSLNDRGRSLNDHDRSRKDRRSSSNDRGRFSLLTKKNALTDDSFTELINEVTSPPDRPGTGSGRKSGVNYNVLFREKLQKTKKNRIPDIFNAILKEIGSISLKHGKTAEKQRQKPLQPRKPKIKTLKEVLESEESLITAEYTIPRSMIKKEAIERLQTLIDRANKRSRVGRSTASESQGETSVVFEQSDGVAWKETERPTAPVSYYTTVINDRDAVNINASSSAISGPICRICHGRHGTLVKPCRCRGTLAYVHVECLQVWLTEKEVNFCELCNFTFRVIHVPEYKIIPSIGFWYKFATTNKQRRMMMVDMTLAIVLLPFLIFLTILVRSFTSNEKTGFEEDDEFEDNIAWYLGQAAIKVATFLVIVSYIAGVLIRLNYHLHDWFTWYVNKNVTVVLEDRRQSGGDEED